MRENTLPKSYFETVSQRNWATRALALIGAFAMNAALFAAMSCLLRPVRTPPQFEQIVPHVSVVRVKRPETPVKK